MIDRTTIYGNPWHIGPHMTRTQALKNHRDWLSGKKIPPHPDLNRKDLIKMRRKVLRAIPKLKGKILKCWCKPNDCHGDYLLKLANR